MSLLPKPLTIPGKPFFVIRPVTNGWLIDVHANPPGQGNIPERVLVATQVSDLTDLIAAEITGCKVAGKV